MGKASFWIRASRCALALVATAAIALAGAAPASAVTVPETGTISGTVTQNVGGVVSPVAGTDVEVWSSQVAHLTTDASGHYSASSLAPGTYTVEFNPWHRDGLEAKYYDNASTRASATSVVVGAGATVTGIDSQLTRGSTITGKLEISTAGKVSPAVGASVDAFALDNSWSGNAETNMDGTYSLSGLKQGNYKLKFSGSNGATSKLIPEWYSDASDFAAATPIALGAQATVTGINATLETGGTLSGTVTQSAGTSSTLPYINVRVYSAIGQTLVASGGTNQDGSFSVSPVPAGRVVVRFSPGWSVMAPKYYGGSADFGSATRIDVGAAATITGINTVLEFGSTLSGTVTKSTGSTVEPAAGVWVGASESSGPGESYTAQTDAAGRYTISGLAKASFKVHFRSNTAGFVNKYYTNAVSGSTADLVAVGAMTTVTGINIDLEKESRIIGTMTKKVNGVVTPAAGLPVSVYSAVDGEYIGAEAAGSDGKFSLGSLMAGTYKVGFNQYGSGSSLDYVPEFFDNATDIASATTITVGTATTVAGINGEISDRPIVANPTPADSVDRVSGDDRFATSSAISAKNFDAGVDVAYIANGANFPDALSAAPVAGKDHAPVLLITATAIPQAVKTELTRLKPKRIVVLGGQASVSDTVALALKAYTAGNVTRSSGADRFATSAAISLAAFTPGVNVVYIANGYNFPDALSAAPVAGKDSAPVLLVPADRIPDEIATELRRLKPKRVVVLGGVTSVSETVTTQLADYTDGIVTRVSGADRFATSAAVSKAAFPTGATTVYIANGFNFPDALSAAPVAGKNSSPVLLVPADRITTEIKDELTRLKPARIIVLGGPNSVSADVAKQLLTYIVAP